jgi:hypothetical protein
LLGKIGVHTKNFAAVQSQIAQTIKQFVMCLTGNNEVSKETLSKQINFITIEGVGTKFLKRVMKRVDLLGQIQEIEDRFLPDGEKQFLIIVVESLMKGQKVSVQKVKAFQESRNHGSSSNG